MGDGEAVNGHQRVSHLDLGGVRKEVGIDPAAKIVVAIATVHGWDIVFIQQSSS
jgi:hypothetical protein